LGLAICRVSQPVLLARGEVVDLFRCADHLCS
jgi:hypothetical protein